MNVIKTFSILSPSRYSFQWIPCDNGTPGLAPSPGRIHDLVLFPVLHHEKEPEEGRPRVQSRAVQDKKEKHLQQSLGPNGEVSSFPAERNGRPKEKGFVLCFIHEEGTGMDLDDKNSLIGYISASYYDSFIYLFNFWIDTQKFLCVHSICSHCRTLVSSLSRPQFLCRLVDGEYNMYFTL